MVQLPSVCTYICIFSELVKILLEAGGLVNDETKKGHTPLHIAAQNGHVDIINEFARHNVNMRMVTI